MTAESTAEAGSAEKDECKGDGSSASTHVATTTEADPGIMPQTFSAATTTSEIVKGVISAVEEAVEWVERKFDELGAKNEDGVGPYASPATCVPSGLDPIASGILPAMEAEKSMEDHSEASEGEEPIKEGSEKTQ